MTSQPQINPDDLTLVDAGGFNAVADAYARDEDNDTLWFISMLGNQTALKSIAAQLFNQPPKDIYLVVEHEQDPSKDTYLPCRVPRHTIGTWTHKIVRMPTTRVFHSLVYTKKAEYAHNSKDFLLLARTPEEAPRLHYLFLDRRVNIPLHELWADWLWSWGLEEGCINPLQSKGVHAYLCDPNEEALKGDLSAAISERELQLPRGSQGDTGVPGTDNLDLWLPKGTQADNPANRLLAPALTT